MKNEKRLLLTTSFAFFTATVMMLVVLSSPLSANATVIRNSSQTTATPDGAISGMTFLGYTSLPETFNNGGVTDTIWIQNWAYEYNGYMYYLTNVSVSAGGSYVLDGNYQWYSSYNVIGSHVTSTFDYVNPFNGEQFYAWTPTTTITSGQTSQFTYGLTFNAGYSQSGGSIGVSVPLTWTMTYYGFEQSMKSTTPTNIGWTFYDNQDQVLSTDPTAVTYTGGATVPVDYGQVNGVYFDATGQFLQGHWWGDTLYTDSLTNYSTGVYVA